MAGRSGRDAQVAASLLEAEKIRYERRSQKVLSILARKDERIAELERQLDESTLRKEVVQAKQREGELREKVRDQSEQIEVLINEVASLRQEVAQTQQLAQDQGREEPHHASRRPTESGNALDSGLKEAVEALKAERNGALEKIQQLEDLLKTARETAVDTDAQLHAAKEHIRKLTSSSGEDPIAQQVRQLELQVAQLQSALQASENKAAELARQNEVLVHTPKPRFSSSHGEKTSTRQSVGSSKNSKQVGATSETIIVQQSDELIALRSELVRVGARARQQQQDYEFEKRSLVNKLRNTELQLRQASEAGAVHRTHLESTIRSLSAKSDLHEQLAQQASTVRMLRQANTELETRVGVCQRDLETSQELLQSSRAIIVKLESELTSFRMSTTYANLPAPSLQVVLQRLAKEVEDLKAQNEHLERNQASLTASDAVVPYTAPYTAQPWLDETHLDEDLLSHSQQRRVSAQLRFRLRAFELRVEALTQDLEQANARGSALSNALATVEAKHEQANLNVQKQHGEQLAALNRRLTAHLQEKQIYIDEKEAMSEQLEKVSAYSLEYEEKFASLKEKYLSTTHSLNGEIETLKSDAEKLVLQLKSSEDTHASDKRRLAYLEETLDVLQGDADSENVHTMLANLGVRLNESEKNKALLKEQVMALEQEKLEADQAYRQLDKRAGKLEQHLRDAEFAREEEASRSRESREKLSLAQRELNEARQTAVSAELQVIDAKVAMESAVADRDVATEQLVAARELFDSKLKAEHNACKEAICNYELGAGKRDSSEEPTKAQAIFQAKMDQLKDLAQQLTQAHRDYAEASGQVGEPILRGFERLAEMLLKSEETQLRQAAELRIKEWQVETLELKAKQEASDAAANHLDRIKYEAENDQLRRVFELESALQQLLFNKRLSAEQSRVQVAEALFVRANAQLKAMKRHNATDGLGADTPEGPNDLLADYNALHERFLAVKSELSDANFRIEQMRATNDGEEEKQRSVLGRERKAADTCKAQVLMLQDQLQASKSELVSLAFEYETKLMTMGNLGSEAATAACETLADLGTIEELQRRTLDQSRENSALLDKIADLQAALARASQAESRHREEIDSLSSQLLREKDRAQIAETAVAFEQSRRNDTTNGDAAAQTGQSLRDCLLEVQEQNASVLVEQKNAQLEALRGELMELKQQVIDTSEENKSLSEANAKVVEKLHKFRRYFEKSKQQDADKVSHLPDRTISALCERLHEFLAVLHSPYLENAVDQLRQLLNRYCEQPELEAANRQLSQANATLSQLEAQLASKEEELSRARNHDKASETEFSERMQACQDSLNERIAYAMSLEKQNKTLEDESTRLRGEVSELQEKLSTLLDTDLEFRSQLESMEEEVQAAKANEERTAQLLECQSKELAELQQASSRDKLLAEAEQERERLQSVLEQQQQEMVKQSLAEQRHLERIQALEKRVSTLKSSLARSKEQIASVKRSWAPQEETKKLKLELGRVKEGLRKAKAQIARKAELLNAAMEKASADQAGEETQRRRAAKLEARVQTLESEIASRESAWHAGASNMEHAKAESEKLKTELERTESNLDSLKRQRDSLRNRVAMLHDQVAHLKTSPPRFSDGSRVRENPILSQLQHTKQAKDKEEQLRRAVSRLKARISTFEKSSEKLQEKAKASEEKCHALVLELSQCKSTLASVRSKVKTLESDKQKLESRLGAAQALAEERKMQAIGAGKALREGLLRIADEAFVVRKLLSEERINAHASNSGPCPETDDKVAQTLAQMLELSSNDVRDILSAEARSNDPALHASLEAAHLAVQQQKNLIDQMLSKHIGEAMCNVPRKDLEYLIQTTCRLFESAR